MNFKIKKFIQSKIKCVFFNSSILFYFLSTTHGSSVDIECTYEYESWGIQSIGSIYECECKNSIKVAERNTFLNNVTGRHENNKTNEDVQGIHIIGASYLPVGIQIHFPNLIGLSIEQHLKEITQSDLKSFPKLQHIWLARNQLEIIEKDLFEFNPDLVYISLRQNFIKEIDSTVFDNLKHLIILELDRNECINDNAVGYYAVSKLIQQTKKKCAVTKNAITTTEKYVNEKEKIEGKSNFWMYCSVVLGTLFFIMLIFVIFLITKHEGRRFNFVLFKNF